MSDTTITRRVFLKGSAAATIAAASGCATNPVTGRRQLMLMSKDDEIRLDQKHAPHQISFDYGPLVQPSINNYIASTGNRLAPLTHRPDMPFSFRGVNAVHVNAYAFPGGTIAVTRGLLLEMQDEAQLAALLGHEIGHVTARHSAAAMSTAMMTQFGLLLAGTAIALYDDDYTELAVGLGGVGAFLFLAKYSRDNEREADKLGIRYMSRAGYDPEGMVGLMNILRDLNRRKPNALEVMVSTHPMSEERYREARRRAERMREAGREGKTHGERYMDNTEPLRRQAAAIRAMQEGERAMVRNKTDEARSFFAEALDKAPEDYTALLLMAKFHIARENYPEAISLATAARDVNPAEPQSLHVGGIANLRAERYDEALSCFEHYETLLAGNPNTVFYKGYTLEKMQRRAQAIEEYRRYLQQAPNGEHAAYVRKRLKEWNQHV